MIKIICGQKGKGKTKHLLKLANESVKDATGSVVYLDKSSKHTFELNNQIRLIDMSAYPVYTSDSFVGFVSGLISGNHDINVVFFDSFLQIANISKENITDIIDTLEKLGGNSIEFILSISLDEDDLPQPAKDKVIVAC